MIVRACRSWTQRLWHRMLPGVNEIPAATIVGREDHKQFLAEQLDHLQSGGWLVGIGGEPGIGKSVLLRHVAESARTSGFTVLDAQGTQSEADLPFAALHQLLQTVLARSERLPAKQQQALLACFGMSDETEVNPFFASLAVLELLVEVSGQGPVLICLDDLHRMDQPSVELLAFVMRRIAAERIGVLFTFQGDNPLDDGDLPVTSIELTGLDPAAVENLLRIKAPDLDPELRDRVRREANGNPLALAEFAAALQSGRYPRSEVTEDLPMTTRLERALLARVQDLEPAARTVLELAALNDGEDLDDVLAAAKTVLGTSTGYDPVRPAVELGLLTVTGHSYRINHALLGPALRHAMSTDARRQGHAAFARVLSSDPHRASWHRAAAATAPDEQLAAELEAAAADARRRGAVSTALALLERAGALSPEPAARANRLLSAAEYGYELGRFSHVEHIVSAVSRLELPPRERSRLTWLAGVFHDGSTSEPAEILHLVSLADRATDAEDSELALQLLIGASRRVWWRDPGEEVRKAIVRSAQQVSVPPEDPRRLAVLGLSESVEQGSVIGEQLTRWPSDAGGRPDLAGLLGIAAFCIGDFARANAYLSSAIEAVRAQGQLSLLAEALALRSWTEINLGIFDAARSADEAKRLADETRQPVWAAAARIAIAVSDAVSSPSPAGTTLLSEAEKTALKMPNASSSLLAAAQLVKGIAALGADRPEPAYEELHRVFVPIDPAHQRVQQLWTVSYLADAAVRTGRRAEAGRVVESMEQLLGAFSALGPQIALEYARAVLADEGSAEALFLAALAGAGQPYPWHRARLELAYGSWLRRQRRVVDSRPALRSARSTFDVLGAHAWANRADHELRATGERGWRSSPRPRAQLSPQESQIADLAAIGLSNREIAERLFLSHRTVSSHLYRIFPKLGITSRSQLAASLASGQAQS